MASFSLSDSEKKTLLKISRKSLLDLFHLQSVSSVSEDEITPNLNAHLGIFVSLHNHGLLRGCLGRFQIDAPLHESVKEMAVSAALNDHRFESVSKEELNDIDIEISILTPLKKIDSIDEIIPGKHGIYIKSGFNSGTFLPQVAERTGWTIEEFLGHCSRDKAGIGWDGWKKAEIYTYEAIVFEEDQ